jgi:hypothetical protein
MRFPLCDCGLQIDDCAAGLWRIRLRSATSKFSSACDIDSRQLWLTIIGEKGFLATMTISLTALFDGEVFRPEGPVALKPNTRYRLTLQQETQTVAPQDAWEVLANLAGAIEGPEDWAAEHDHYLYGTPKRREPSDS